MSSQRSGNSGGGSESLVDNFEFELTGGETVPFAGYVSSGDPTILSSQVLIAGSKNVYKDLSGAIKNRFGLSARGVKDNTQAGTLSSFEWESSLGLTRPVRQNNGNLEVEFDPGTGLEWYTIMTGLPIDVISYCPWYDPNAEKDYLLYVNGQQIIYSWQGGVGVILSAADTTGIIGGILGPNTITGATQGTYSSGGTGYIVGDELTVEGGNNDAVLVVDSLGSGGVEAATVAAGGSNYTVGDLVSVAYASGGPIGTFTIIAPGVGYVVGDQITTGNASAILTVTQVSNTGAVTQMVLTDPGTGYTSASDQTTTGGTGIGLTITYSAVGGQALLKVTSVSGGAVTGLAVAASGIGYAIASALTTNNVFVQNVMASGLTVNIPTIGNPIATWHFKNNGSGYALSTAYAPNTVTGGTGTGASVWIDIIVAGRVTLAGTDTVPELGFAGGLSPTNGINDLVGGSFLVDGVSWSYEMLGDEGKSFIGFSSDPSSTTGQVAISAPSSTDTSPDSALTNAQLEEDFTNDAIAVVNNQVHLICYSSRLVHVSSSLHFDHYDVAQLNSGVIRTPGYPDLITLDSNGRAVGAQKGSAVIFGSLGDSYLVARKAAIYNQGTDFAALSYENVTVTKEKSSDLSSPIGQDFLDFIGDIIIFLDDSNQLREYGTVRNINTPVYPILSIDVYYELAGVDFTGGHLRCVGEQSGETVYITAPKTGITYLYQIRQDFDAVGNITAERMWQAPMGWNGSRIAVIDGISYIHSNANPMIYRLWDTGQWHDDAPESESLPYTSIAFFAYQSSGRRQGKTLFDKIYYEGYTTRGTTLMGIVNFEYLGSTDTLNPTITSAADPATFFGSGDYNSLGQHSLGDEPLGDEVENEDPNNTDQTRVKFRAICGVEEANVFEYALGVMSQNTDDRWELLFIGPNAIMSSTDQASELMK